MSTPRQTNLINPSLWPKRDALTPGRMIAGVICAVALLGLSWLVVYFVLSTREAKVSVLKTQSATLSKNLSRLSPQVAEDQKSLELKILGVEQQISASRQLLSTLGQVDQMDGRNKAGGTRNNRHGAILNALSRFESKSLWLEKIGFNPENGLIELNGKTTNSNDIVAYLQFLSLQEEFRGMKFDQIDAHADSKIAGLWIFSIANQKPINTVKKVEGLK